MKHKQARNRHETVLKESLVLGAFHGSESARNEAETETVTKRAATGLKRD